MKTQDTFKFAETHEWASIEDDGLAWIGISNHAQEALGDVMFFQAPKIGRLVKQGEAIAVIESSRPQAIFMRLLVVRSSPSMKRWMPSLRQSMQLPIQFGYLKLNRHQQNLWLQISML